MTVSIEFFLLLTLACFVADIITAWLTWPHHSWQHRLSWAGASTLTFALMLALVLWVLGALTC